MAVAQVRFMISVTEKAPQLPYYTAQTTLLMEGSCLRVGRHLETTSMTQTLSYLSYLIKASKILESFLWPIIQRLRLLTNYLDQLLEKLVGEIWYACHRIAVKIIFSMVFKFGKEVRIFIVLKYHLSVNFYHVWRKKTPFKENYIFSVQKLYIMLKNNYVSQS